MFKNIGKQSKGLSRTQVFAKNQLEIDNKSYDPYHPLNDTNILNESRMFDEISELSDELHNDSYFKNSSLYIFYIDGPFRRFCLTLAEPQKEVDEVLRVRDRIPDYKIKVPLL